MTKSTSMLPFSCTVCGLRTCTAVSLFPFNDHRRPALTPLLYCIDCQSAHFNHEPRNDDSLDWHKRVLQRNFEWSALLLRKLSQFGSPRRVIDIGCGIGTWLHFLDTQGISGLGFDTNLTLVTHARKTLDLDLRGEIFTAENPAARAFDADLLTAIMVMEHLSKPRTLAEQIARYCVRQGSRFYVTVPWFDDLRHLDFDDESKEHSVFNDVGAHVSYFSREGMIRMFDDFGMRTVGTVSGLAWSGLLFEPHAGLAPGGPHAPVGPA